MKLKSFVYTGVSRVVCLGVKCGEEFIYRVHACKCDLLIGYFTLSDCITILSVKLLSHSLTRTDVYLIINMQRDNSHEDMANEPLRLLTLFHATHTCFTGSGTYLDTQGRDATHHVHSWCRWKQWSRYRSSGTPTFGRNQHSGMETTCNGSLQHTHTYPYTITHTHTGLANFFH